MWVARGDFRASVVVACEGGAGGRDSWVRTHRRGEVGQDLAWAWSLLRVCLIRLRLGEALCSKLLCRGIVQDRKDGKQLGLWKEWSSRSEASNWTRTFWKDLASAVCQILLQDLAGG